MKALTEQQIKDVKTLVRLGDTLELAIKTVLSKKELSQECYDFYYNAYHA